MDSHEYFLIEHQKMIVIDPADAMSVDEMISAKDLSLSLIILTHEHCDHNYECDMIRKKYHCKVYASEKCSSNLKDNRKNYSKY